MSESPEALTNILWVINMVLYVGTAIYLRIKYNGIISHRASFWFLAIGLSVFIVLNSRLSLIGGSIIRWREFLIIGLLYLGWYASVTSVRRMIRKEKRRSESDD